MRHICYLDVSKTEEYSAFTKQNKVCQKCGKKIKDSPAYLLTFFFESASLTTDCIQSCYYAKRTRTNEAGYVRSDTKEEIRTHGRKRIEKNEPDRAH